MRELKQESSCKGALAREQAGKKAGRQASTRKAFSRSHALEGLVTHAVNVYYCQAPGKGIGSWEWLTDCCVRIGGFGFFRLGLDLG